jgi:hypothetical protein
MSNDGVLVGSVKTRVFAITKIVILVTGHQNYFLEH